MDNKKKVLLGLLSFALALLLCISLPVQRPAEAASTGTPGKVTFMVYMIGSDLESKASAGCRDLDEIADSGIDLTKTDVLVCAGGTKQWHRDDLSPDADTVLHLTSNGFESVKDFDVQSMGEPDSLSRFLDFCRDSYPADTYYLVLWDHGNGPLLGYGKDTLYKNDALTLSELGTALADSPFGKDNKLGFIGFDACLMSSAELLSVTADYADYLIASQETEPANGWDYSFLKDCGKLSDEELAKKIVDSYHAYYEKNDPVKDGANITLSVMDLSRAKELEKATEELFALAENDVSEKYDELAVSRVKARSPGRASTGSEYDLVDMGSLFAGMESIYSEEAKAAEEILNKTVVYNRSTDGSCCGVSIYYPFYNKQYYQKKWHDIYSGLGVYGDYFSYIEAYSETWLGKEKSESYNNISAPEKTGDTEYVLTLTDEQAASIADSGYYILRRDGADLYTAVFVSKQTSIEGNTVKANFNGKVIYKVEPGGSKIFVALCETDSYGDTVNYTPNTFFASKYSLSDMNNVQKQQQQSLDLKLSLNKKTEKLTLTDVFEAEDDESEDDVSLRSGKLNEFDPNDWGYYNFVNYSARYLTRDKNGRITDYFNWPKNSWVTLMQSSTGDGLNFVYEPIYDDGNEYYIMIKIVDTQGNISASELLPVTLASAPEPAGNPVTCERNDYGAVAIPEIGGLKMSFSAEYDTVSGLRYFLSVENTNDSTVSFSLNNIAIDGINAPNGYAVYIDSLAPGKTVMKSLDDIAGLSKFLGEDIFSQLAFYVNIENTDSNQTLADGQRIVIDNFSFEAEADADGTLGAKTTPQALTSVGDVDISFVKLYVGGDSSDPVVALRYTNNGSEEASLPPCDLYFNGAFITQFSPYESIPAGAEYIIKDEISGYDLYNLGITSLSSIGIGIEADDGYSVFDIAVNGGTAADSKVPDGETLFTDDSVELKYVGVFSNDYYGYSFLNMKAIYRFVIVNKTDSPLSVSAPFKEVGGKTDVNVTSFGSYGETVPGGASMIFTIEVPYDYNSGDLKIELSYGEPGYGKEKTTAGSFTVKTEKMK